MKINSFKESIKIAVVTYNKLLVIVSLFFVLIFMGTGSVYAAWTGAFDSIDSTAISGWMCDPNAPGYVDYISAYEENPVYFIAGESAGEYRADLLGVCGGNGYHGFSITTPSSIRDGVTHNVKVWGSPGYFGGTKAYTETPVCTSVAPSAPSTTATSGTFYTYAYGVSSFVTSVTFPTWGSTNGQNDLVWYSGTNLGGGTWRASIDLASHAVGTPEYGTINTDVYMSTIGGSTYVGCGSAPFTRNLPTYTITATPINSGTISPSGTTVVTSGNSQNFIFTPGTGYYVSAVYVDSIPQGQIGSYNFTNVTANHAVAVTFSPSTYALPGDASSSSLPATRYPLHTGLLLSDIQTLFPDLVKADLVGKSSFSLTNLIPYIIESIKSLARSVNTLATDIASIKHNLITDEVKTKTICLGDTCIDEEKLKGMIEQQTTSQVSSQVSSPTGEQSTGQVLGVSTSTNSTTTATTIIETSTSTTTTTDTSSSTSSVVVSSSTSPTEIITSPLIILDPPITTETAPVIEEVLPASSTGTTTP